MAKILLKRGYKVRVNCGAFKDVTVIAKTEKEAKVLAEKKVGTTCDGGCPEACEILEDNFIAP